MRNAYAIVGLGFVILFAGVYAINARFTKTDDTEIITSATTTMPATFTLTSSAFETGAKIPAKFTCDGDGISPALHIAEPPKGTKSFALIVEDPDVPKEVMEEGLFVHWVLFNIPGGTIDIPENATAGVEGANGAGKQGYYPPCPPPHYQPSEHRYFFHIYALDTELDLQPGATKEELVQAMEGHVLGEAQLIGTYQRS